MDKTKSKLQVMRVLYIAIFLGNFVNLLYAFFLDRNVGFDLSKARPDFSDSLEIMQSLGALVFAVLSIVVPKLMWRNKGREFRDAPGGEPPALNVLIGVYYVPWIIRMAFLNSVTIFGFVISITKHSPARIIPFFVASMIGYLFNFPSEDRIKTSVMNN